MAKNLKINIKNTQLAKAVNLGKLKAQLGKGEKEKAEAKKPAEKAAPKKAAPKKATKVSKAEAKVGKTKAAKSKAAEPSEIKAGGAKATEAELLAGEEAAPKKRKIKARSRSAFAPGKETAEAPPPGPSVTEEVVAERAPLKEPSAEAEPTVELGSEAEADAGAEIGVKPGVKPRAKSRVEPGLEPGVEPGAEPKAAARVPQRPPAPPPKPGTIRPGTEKGAKARAEVAKAGAGKAKEAVKSEPAAREEKRPAKKPTGRREKVREFRDVRPKRPQGRRFGGGESEDGRWRKRRPSRGGGRTAVEEAAIIRPKELKIRLPIAVKDLAGSMKLKSSQLVQTLFMQGLTLTLNDLLDDETTVQLLGQEFGCEITIDTSEEERIRITDRTIREEITESPKEARKSRAPVVAFMGHVDHGKTSLIDRIRDSQIAAGEAGAITQHIGAFKCTTGHGPITILDTPGHEAFTSMRARGADVTDVVVLVIAGDEGMRPQTVEAIQHARAANVTIVVAVNKSDKPGFDADNVYRQLAEQELLPEQWGGTTIAVNCSAVSGEGIDQLLEMIALQAEVLELNAIPSARARGTVIESEMHKGMGIIATVLVQNGTLSHGDAIVIDDLWGRVKTMQDEHGKNLSQATPSTPVAITGLSALPMAGKEFIVVSDEREAREIAAARHEDSRQLYLQRRKRVGMESLLQEGVTAEKKILNLILRADVQGSLEALKSSLIKIESDKAELEIIFSGVGAISESDVELAAASKAVIVGFHTHVEAHAEDLIKQSRVQVRQHDIIYHAIDDVRDLLAGTLEKVAEEIEKGQAEVRAIFKSSQLGVIAGCLVTDGVISRNCRMRQRRGDEVVWTGPIASIRRETEDVREVRQGLECGIVLDGQNDIQEGDQLEAFEIIYVTQEL